MAKGGSKSGSKTLTGILCFIFGFLFAIIVEVALIAGGVYFLMKADIDDVLSLVGVENEDENGNKIVINTNVEEGGVQNITDLVTALRDMFGNGVENLTIGEVEGLFPVADRLVDSIYSGLAGALSAYDLTEEDVRNIIDEEELKATPVSQMGEFISGCLNNVEVATLLRVAGINPQENKMFLSIAYGMEAGVVYGESGDIVLYRDVYTLHSPEAEVPEETPEEGEDAGEEQTATFSNDGENAGSEPAAEPDEETYYVREADGSRLPASMEQYLVPRANGTEYWLYYSVDDSGSALYAEIAALTEGADGEEFALSGVQYSIYDNRIAEVSGAYYYDEQGGLVILDSRTLGDVFEGDGGILSVFSDIYLNDVIGSESGADDLLGEIFDGITVGDILNGNVIFDELLDKVYVPDVLDVMADNSIMMYMGYSIVDIQPAGEVPEGGIATTYTGTAYIYELSPDGSQWVREERPCVIITSDIGIVQEVWFTDEAGNRTEQYGGVSITNINAQTANVLYDLKVKDVIEIDENDRLMSKIGEYAIANVGDAIDEVVLADVLTVDTGTDSFELMAYMVYGINGITPVQSPAYITIGGVQVEYRYTATYHYLYEDDGETKTQACPAYVVTDSEGNISTVYYALAEGGYAECGTRLDDVSSRIDGLMNDLTIGELIGLEEDSTNTILVAISDATINTLGETINNLSIQELFTNEIYGVENPYEVIESGEAEGKIAFDSSYLYYYKDGEDYVLVDADYVYGNDPVAGNEGHISEGQYSAFVQKYDTLYTYGPTAGAWSLLLYGDYDTTAEGSDIGEKVYTINNVAQMQANVIANIANCSLNDFKDMGVIEYSETLGVSLSTIFPEYSAEGKTTVGDLTISEFLDALGTLVPDTNQGDQGATVTP